MTGDSGIANSASWESNGVLVTLEHLVAGVWREVLATDQIGVHDHFFKLGGHSLLAMQMVARLRDRYGLSLTVEQVFKAPTIRKMTEMLSQAHPNRELEQIVRRARPSTVPVSAMQEAHLKRCRDRGFVRFTDPEQNLCMGLTLTGELDAAALERALKAICDRHESLRTTFDTSTTPPSQVVHPPGRFEFTRVVDLSAISEPEQPEALERAIEAAKKWVIDYIEGPQVQFTIIRLNPARHVLVMVTNELVLDLWSIGVLFDEMNKLYGASLRGEEVTLPVPLQYPDVIVWQRQQMRENEQETLKYWKDVVDGAETLGLKFPFALPRPEKFEYRVGLVDFDLADLQPAVQRYCEARTASIYSFYLASYVVLLHALSGAKRVYLYTPSAQRTRLELERVIGRLSRSLTVRFDVDAEGSFNELVDTVSQTVLRAQEKLNGVSAVRMLELLPKLDITKPVSYLGFTFDYHHQLRLPGVEASQFPISTHIGPWLDLNLRIAKKHDGTSARLRYNIHSFTTETARHIMNAYIHGVRHVLSEGATPIREIVAKLDLAPLV